jgi:hypothetical protein
VSYPLDPGFVSVPESIGADWVLFFVFPQLLQANIEIVPEFKPQLLPFLHFSVHYSLILSFDAV